MAALLKEASLSGVCAGTEQCYSSMDTDRGRGRAAPSPSLVLQLQTSGHSIWWGCLNTLSWPASLCPQERLLQLQSAAEELVHAPHSPASSGSPTHLQSAEQASTPVEAEAEVSRERLLAVLGRMGPHDSHPVVVPCVCCSGEVIHV